MTFLHYFGWLSFAGFLLFSEVVCENYYDLLGVARDANNREIRRAFKKLALSLHPDKNLNDPEASEKFVKVNHAYEVLKDEEKRKIYDVYGEDGLKDDFQSDNTFYKSWNYYYEKFGIYDDDPEIVTLNKADFEQSVTGTADVWFINFYSPSCSHCHQLAPTWREIAQELESVVRIGAVNCEEDWGLCRQQGIQSYPSLMIYPKGEKYRGERTTSQLIKFIMKQIDPRIVDLWEGNFYKYLTDDGFPWLITFCNDDGDCPTELTIQKIAAMLDGLVNIGTVDCTEQKNLCLRLGQESGVHYFTSFKESKSQKINSNEAKEISRIVIEFLPEILSLKSDEFQGLYEALQAEKGEPWLIEFMNDNEPVDLQIRKLPALLPNINVGRMDCSDAITTCQSFFIHKYPTIGIFKQGGGYEIYHGRRNAHDIAIFAEESLLSNVRVLGPNDFPHKVINEEATWFIDFYAPWCPPCMRLLPEWRKASRSLGDGINFGTVDCTIHQPLCNKYNIRSYPTTILYNQSVPHQHYGYASAAALVEFVQDVLSPPVISLNQKLFEQQVANRPNNELWVVDFFAPWCQPCQQLSIHWRKLAKMFSSHAFVNIAQVDCTKESALCDRQYVQSYPTIRLYPINSIGVSHYYAYDDWNRDAVSLRGWIHQYLPSKVVALGSRDFQSKVLSSSQPWVIDFYAPWCGHCQIFAPEFDAVAESLHEEINFGKVNCEQHHQTCNAAGIRAYPTVIFFPGVTAGHHSQSSYGEIIESQDGSTIISLLKQKLARKPEKHNDIHDEL